MFKQRLLTTLILVPLVLAAIYFTSPSIFAGLILILLLACANEWPQLIPTQSLLIKGLFIAALLVLTVLAYFIFPALLQLNLLLLVLILLAVIKFPKWQQFWGYSGVVALVGLLFLASFGHSMVHIQQQPQGKSLVVYLLLLIWAADIGAYLIGKQYGQHKLLPAVSPGKTIEGSLGGILLSLLVTIAGYYNFHPPHLMLWLLLGLLTGLVSILGDLFISILKRRVKIKDTGQLLPGHGGVLDRLDSLITAAPFFYWGLSFFFPGF